MPHLEIIIGLETEVAKANHCLTHAESNIAHGDYQNQGKQAQIETAMENLETIIEDARDNIAEHCAALMGII